MAIEAVTYPADLRDWDPQPDRDRFYFELYGETQPLVDATFAEVLPAGPTDGAAQTANPTPIYEFWWTIGHPGHATRHGRTFVDHLLHRDDGGFWSQLADDAAAHVYFFFPLGGGWRIKELAATLKYLSPAREEKSFWKTAAEDWTAIQPFVSVAGGIATAANPIAGAAAKDVGGLLTALAKLKLTSVPPSKEFDWSAAKVTTNSDEGVVQGVMWKLPKSVFELLGGRITGSLAVSFIPASTQADGNPSTGSATLECRPLLAHAGVFAAGGIEEWKPAKNDFLKLYIEPRMR